MIHDIDLEKPAWTMTVGELIDAIADRLDHKDIPEKKVDFTRDDRFAYGIGGIAAFMGCSRPTIHNYKRAGKFDRIIIQYSTRKIVAEKTKLVELMEKLEEEKTKEVRGCRDNVEKHL